jgi:hypothetical protein
MSTLRTVVLLFLFAGMALAQESLPGFLNRPKIEDKLLPKANISKAAGELSFINTTSLFLDSSITCHPIGGLTPLGLFFRT